MYEGSHHTDASNKRVLHWSFLGFGFSENFESQFLQVLASGSGSGSGSEVEFAHDVMTACYYTDEYTYGMRGVVEHELLAIHQLETAWEMAQDLMDGEFEGLEVYAWSFGVAAAMKTLSYFKRTGYLDGIQVRLTAVAGSPFLVDDKLGIPSKVFARTLRKFSRQMLSTFADNMLEGATASPDLVDRMRQLYREYYSTIDDACIDGLQLELKLFPEIKLDLEDEDMVKIDRLVIADHDVIFPKANLEAFAEFYKANYNPDLQVDHLNDSHLPLTFIHEMLDLSKAKE